MVEDCKSIQTGVTTAEDVMEIDVEHMLVAGGRVPSAFAGNFHMVGTATDHRVNAVAGLLVGRAPIHAIVDGIGRVHHLGAVEFVGGDPASALVNDCLDHPVVERGCGGWGRQRDIRPHTGRTATGVVGLE